MIRPACTHRAGLLATSRSECAKDIKQETTTRRRSHKRALAAPNMVYLIRRDPRGSILEFPSNFAFSYGDVDA